MTTHERLYHAIKRHADLEDETIIDAGAHGADAGWGGFTYYRDTCAFTAANRRNIADLVEQVAEEFGQGPVELVASFNCLRGHDVTQGEIGRALYGSPESDDDSATFVDNALAWFALEEVGRWLESQREESEATQ